MRVLAISEHYFPRLGGTVNYVHETLSALTQSGVSVELWVPGPEPANWLPRGLQYPKYELRWIDADYPVTGDPTRKERYEFCDLVNEKLLALANREHKPSVLHIMYGLFLMEKVQTENLRNLGIPSVATVHNIPPHECGLITDDAAIWRKAKEKIRLSLVSWKNNIRLVAHEYDAYITPSNAVERQLVSILPDSDIVVIGHGPSKSFSDVAVKQASKGAQQNKPFRILTVGGYAPHKRQHLIPRVAQELSRRGLTFNWTIVGPAGRVPGYHQKVVSQIRSLGLEKVVSAKEAASFEKLRDLYSAADLYVQPSIEEGFCITALDAAALGIPVIASPAGALEKIAQLSAGKVIESEPGPLSDAIAEFMLSRERPEPREVAERVKSQFSWEIGAEHLLEVYQRAANSSSVSA